MRPAFILCSAVFASIVVACLEKPPGTPDDNSREGAIAIAPLPKPGGSAATASPDEAGHVADDGAPSDPADDKDPVAGNFTLADATATLPGSGLLVATIKTSMGQMKCRLFEDKAPITVANFVGLARGVRPWRSPKGRWVRQPLYDGTTFHRIIKGFMIQGGDPAGDGTGGPGFVIPDEIWAGSKHDRAGQLCMANRGPNTNGAQFFITDAKVPQLDSNYTIFGECAPASIVHAIASVSKDQMDRPHAPVKIEKVEIAREASTPAP